MIDLFDIRMKGKNCRYVETLSEKEAENCEKYRDEIENLLQRGSFKNSERRI